MTGRLYAVGGAEDHERNPVVLETFLRLCGGREAHVAVVTAAAEDGERAWQRYQNTFRRLGAESVFWGDEGGPDADWWPAVTGIWLAGGDQLRLCQRLDTLGLLDRLRERYRSGATLAGTSAGAAALSEVMIAGGSARHPHDVAGVQLARGLGFWPDAIIDQHFSQRGRLARLLAAILAHPNHYGIGIDEDTAVLTDPTRQTVTCIGHGTVSLVVAATASDARAANGEPSLFVPGLQLWFLTPGATWRRVQELVP
jgi:cyanophycinase